MISLITVNYNNAPATEKLLHSLELQTDNAFDVFVIDNASSEADREKLGHAIVGSPLSTDLILNEHNRGFSGGNNVGIRKALEQARPNFAKQNLGGQGSTWVVLLNNDTTVPPDFIASLRPQLLSEPAVIGIPLQEGMHTAYAGIVKWLHATLPHLHASPSNLAPRTSHPLYAIGAGIAIHRNVFERIGLLDERYFLYFEDADYSLRAEHAGIAVRFLSRPVIAHGVSETTAALGSPLLLRYHARNALLFNSLHGPWWVRLILPLTAVYGIFLQLVKILLMPSRRAPSRAILSGIIDFYAKRFGHISTTSDNRRD